MHQLSYAPGFIQAIQDNMPLGKSGTVSGQDGWDVPVFMNRVFNASAASRTTPSVG